MVNPIEWQPGNCYTLCLFGIRRPLKSGQSLGFFIPGFMVPTLLEANWETRQNGVHHN